MANKLFATFLFLVSTTAFGQISLDELKPVYFKCPQIAPPTFEQMDGTPERASQVTFEHYFIPVMKVGRYATYLLNPAGGVTQELYGIYKNHVKVSEQDYVLIELVRTIQQAYYSQATFGKLDTKGALALLSNNSKSEYSSVLGKAIVCIAPAANNPSMLEVNFYGLRDKDCKNLRTNTAFGSIATKISVNGDGSGSCEKDFKGKGLKFFRLWSNYGRNQLTFIFPKNT